MTTVRSPERARTRRLTYALVAAVVVLGVALLFALFAGEDGRDEAFPAHVRDLESIVDGEIVVQVHGDGTATVHVDTTLDLVCAVAFGTTEALGFVATDDDMAGGGHANHHPLLVGLQENTDYFYKLQGIGPDGTLYVGELATFRNGPHIDAAPSSNLAVEASVTDVSSEFSSQFGAGRAIDGERSTQWSSAGDGDDAYIVIDLGAEADLAGVGFRTREMSDGTSITTSFTVIIDGAAPLGPFASGPGLAVAAFVARGQLVRIDVATSTGGNTGAIEIEIYGSLTGETG